MQAKPLAGQITPLVQREVEEDEPELNGSGTVPPLQRQVDDDEAELTGSEAVPPLQRQIEDDKAIQAKSLIQRQSEETGEIRTMPLIHRQNAEAEELHTEPAIQHQAETEDLPQQLTNEDQEASAQSNPVQPKNNSPTTSHQVSPALQSRLNASKGGGQPLSESSRTFFEPRFGVNFSQVRVHTDSQASEMNRQLNARAFTTGQNIYFGAGQYAPGTQGGNNLLAHELTHVVQQGKPVQTKPLALNPTEKENNNLNQDNADEDNHLLNTLSPDSSEPLSNASSIEEEQPPGTKQPSEPSANSEKNSTPATELPGEPMEAEALEMGAVPPPGVSNIATQPSADISTMEERPAGEAPIPETAPAMGESSELQGAQEQIDGNDQPAGTPPALQGESPQSQDTSIATGTDSLTEPEGKANDNPPSNINLGNLVSSNAASLEAEAQSAAEQAVRGENIESSPTPTDLPIQFSLWSGARNLIGRGVSWLGENVVGPIQQIASAGWDIAKNAGSQISAAYQQANASGWDILQPQYLLFRIQRNLRRNAYQEAMQQERERLEESQASGTEASSDAGAASSERLERLELYDGIANTFESGMESYFEVNKELIEGAVLGDFKENPTIWNTIGQVVVGFIPYAGQVADIRDLIASLKKIIFEEGYKDPWEWFNLVLVLIGIIPGFGDAIKALGRGAKGAIRDAISWLARHGDEIWQAVSRRVGDLLPAIRRRGRQLLEGARESGRRLLQSGRELGQRLLDSVRSGAQRVRGMIGRLRERAGSLARSVRDGARNLVNRARGFLSGIVGSIARRARSAFESARNAARRGIDFVRRNLERGKALLNRLREGIAEGIRRARTFLRDSVNRAIETGRALIRAARNRLKALYEGAVALGRRLVNSARQRISNLIKSGVKWVKERAIRWIIDRFQSVKQRILRFLRDRWNRLKERFGKKGKTSRPGLSPGELYEQQIKDRFRKKIINENEILTDSAGNVIGQIDFETSEALVEVGLSLGNKSNQLHRLAAIAQQRAKRLDVIFDPLVTPQGRLEAFRRSLRLKWGNRVRFIPINYVEP